MKKIIVCAAVIAVSIFGVIKANDINNKSTMSNLQMENIELLAEGEPTEADCAKVCGPAPNAHCDIAYISSQWDFRRCEGWYP